LKGFDKGKNCFVGKCGLLVGDYYGEEFEIVFAEVKGKLLRVGVFY
jgi:hypothetical protein